MDSISQVDTIITETQDVLSKLQALRTDLLPKTYYSKARFDTIPAPLPAIPAPSSSFVDPTFGSRMKRVSSIADNVAPFRVPSNAHLAAWSADSKQFALTTNAGPKIFNFSPTAFVTSMSSQAPYSQVEPTFSRTLPSVMYVVGGPKTRTLQKYDTGTFITTNILDLDTLNLANLDTPRTYVGGIIEANGKLVASFGGQGQDGHYFVIVHDLVSSTHIILNTQTQLNCKVHGISIDMSGRYVFIYPANAQPYQVIVWDIQTNTTTPIIVSPAGHDAQGYGEWVNMDVSSGPWDAAQWSYRKITDLNNPVNLIPSVLLPKEVYMADHTSWNHAQPNVRVPVISGTYQFGQGFSDPPRAWNNEIIAIATDGTGRVDRFCHHRSIISDDINPAIPYFWYEPIPNVSPDGKWALFTSNWGKTLGPDSTDPRYFRTDVFLVELL